jgi:hypothetical protein
MRDDALILGRFRLAASILGLTALMCSLPAASIALSGQSATPAQESRQPVLVELFTSEGCSSCPPADALLARLDATQFVPGAHAIVLSEHVTYWNDGGWHDPFSQELFTDRQHDYVVRLGLESAYTPQVVVDGVIDVLGNDAGALARQVKQAAAKPKPQLTIKGTTLQGDTLHFAVQTADTEKSQLWAALAEDQAQSSVARGENAGRTLRHVAVVRVLKNMGSNVSDGRPLTLNVAADKGAAAPNKALRLVVFLVDPHSGRVRAAADQTLFR